LADKKCQQIFLDAKINKRELRLKYNKQGLRIRYKKGKEQCDIYKKNNINTEKSKAQQRTYINKKQKKQKQDKQDKGKRQDWWINNGVNVPSSSVPVLNINITERNSSIDEASSSRLPILPVNKNNRHSYILASAIHSYSSHSLVSFDQGFAADVITKDKQEEFAA
jgi:hypothetical protein